MTGEGGLTYKQLRDVAAYFGRGVLFFLEPTPVLVEKVQTPQFRSIANQKPELSPKLKALIQRVEHQRDIFLSLKEDLEAGVEISFDPPQLPRGNLRMAARIVRQWLDIGEENSFNTYRLAVEAKGILVFRSNGYNGKWQIPKNEPICGFTIYNPDCPVIVVKKEISEGRQAFTLFHELAHVLLHKASYIDELEDLYSYRGKEREANEFAGLVLVPDQFLSEIGEDQPQYVAQFEGWLHEYKNRWGVSVEVILRRMLDNQRIEQATYEEYRSWKKQQSAPESTRGNRKNRYQEPKQIFGESFVRTVFDALRAQHITLARASTYLDNLKIADVHRLEDSFAGL